MILVDDDWNLLLLLPINRTGKLTSNLVLYSFLSTFKREFSPQWTNPHFENLYQHNSTHQNQEDLGKIPGNETFSRGQGGEWNVYPFSRKMWHIKYGKHRLTWITFYPVLSFSLCDDNFTWVPCLRWEKMRKDTVAIGDSLFLVSCSFYSEMQHQVTHQLKERIEQDLICF